jgi:TorA maturation chaperone TorD
MNTLNLTHITPHILRFYAKCFIYPYEEMNYEFLYLFRMIERMEICAAELTHVDQILNVINQYQGAEIRIIRDEYAILFTHLQNTAPLCPIVASEFLANFAKHYNLDYIDDLLLNSGIPINSDEPLDSIINYLEILSLFCEELYMDDIIEIDFDKFMHQHILNWIPLFCDVLYKATSLNFYHEVSTGLKNFLLFLK